jgi:hypothetical protein
MLNTNARQCKKGKGPQDLVAGCPIGSAVETFFALN